MTRRRKAKSEFDLDKHLSLRWKRLRRRRKARSGHRPWYEFISSEMFEQLLPRVSALLGRFQLETLSEYFDEVLAYVAETEYINEILDDPHNPILEVSDAGRRLRLMRALILVLELRFDGRYTDLAKSLLKMGERKERGLSIYDRRQFSEAVDIVIQELRENWRVAHPTKYEQLLIMLAQSEENLLSLEDVTPLFKDTEDPEKRASSAISRLSAKLEPHNYRIVSHTVYSIEPIERHSNY